MNTIEITSHELAKKLLAGPDLPVMRHTDDDTGMLKPLSHVAEVDACDEDGEATRKVVVVDSALTPNK